jgi:integrase
MLKISYNDLELMIKKFIVYEQKEKQSPAHARMSLYAIKHFCRMNKIKLDWDVSRPFQSKLKSKKYSAEDDAYTHNQINQLLSVCDIREKALVLIYASTGIRVSALPPPQA